MQLIPDASGNLVPAPADQNSDLQSPETGGSSTPSYSFQSVTLAKSPGIIVDAGTLANARFDQYVIKAKIVVYHNGTAYDVTPYLMQIKTHMGLGEPSGTFTMLLTFQKRWDLLFQSQDYVEIRFGRYLNQPAMIMRGLINNVRRTRIMDDSGKLHRGITINGENFGKIWRKYQIENLVQEPGQRLPGQDNMLGGSVTPDVAANGLFQISLTENYGIGNDTGEITLRDLMQGITDNILNAQLKVLQQVTPQIPLLRLYTNVLTDYVTPGVNPQLQQIQDTVYNAVQQFANMPWCEAFIDESADGPVFFHRNTPFKRQDGSYALPESEPDSNYFLHPTISDVDVIEEDLGHSDDEVYSYFFTYPTLYTEGEISAKATITSDLKPTFATESDTQNITNPHVDADNLYRYGFSMMDMPSIASPITGTDWEPLCLRMNQWLVECFSWTQFMLNGTITMKGNEHMRIGRYFTNTSTNEEYYIESVDHELVFSQTNSLGNDNVVSFRTTVGVTRGRKLG